MKQKIIITKEKMVSNSIRTRRSKTMIKGRKRFFTCLLFFGTAGADDKKKIENF